MELCKGRIFLFLALSLIIHGVAFLAFDLRVREVAKESITIELQTSSHKSKLKTRSVSHTRSGTQSDQPSEASEEMIAGSALGLRAEYPRLSRILGEEGRVVIEVIEGRAKLLSPSGHPRLDTAGLAAVRAGLESGVLTKRIEAEAALKISFVFRLREQP